MVPLLLLVMVCGSMIVAHEAGHVIVTQCLGGKWLGIEFRGYAVGVRLSVHALSSQQLAWTCMAGPLAEAVIALGAVVVWPEQYRWWLLLLTLEWLINLVPWGRFPNDGTRAWRLWRTGVLAAAHRP